MAVIIPATPAGTVAPSEVRKQLERILSSRAFSNVDRLKRFLEFIVIETLEGRGEQLKEYPIGVEVFDKLASFDSRTDPIVRVQARRLRSRLDLYYQQEGSRDRVLIQVRKGNYGPVFLEADLEGDEAIPRQPRIVNSQVRRAVTVQFFADNTSSRDHDGLCRGLRDEILNRLLHASACDLVESADGALSTLVVSGGLQQSGTKLRVSWQLADSGTGRYLNSGKIDGDSAGIFELQDEAACQILNAVENSDPARDQTARVSSRRHSEVWNLCLQGRYHLSQRSEDDLRRAAEFFEKAIAHDGSCAEAYSGLADAFALMCHYGAAEPASLFTRIAENAVQAVALDEKSVEARTTLAHVKATQDWDWVGAAREFQRAIALDPEYPLAHHWYAMSSLVPQGKIDEALLEMNLAQSLDPVSSIISRDIAVLHYFKRNFGAALDQCDRTIERNPHFAGTYWILGLVQARRGEFDEGIAACRRALELSPNGVWARGELGHMLAQAGRTDEARAIVAELEQRARTSHVPPFKLALIYFGLGDWDAAFDLLSRARAERSFELTYLSVDPRFDFLHGEPRFTAFVKQLGL